MNLTEQKLYKSLRLELKKRRQRIIEEVGDLTAGEDVEVRRKRVREIEPVLEFESKKFPEFKKLLKKFRNNINKELNDVGEVWLFVHGDSSCKKLYESFVDKYVPATISPLPSDQFWYKSVFINKNIVSESNLSGYCNRVELKKVKVRAYSPDDFLIYIDEIENKDIFDILKFYKNFGDDRSRNYRSIIRDLSDDRAIADDLGASTLSAFDGMSYSVASGYKHGIEPNIRGTYSRLQILLPPLFRREEFSLKFDPNSNILHRNKKIKIKCKPIPVYDFDPDHLYLKSYQRTHPNQTWAALIGTPRGDYAITSILNLFQTANCVTNVKDYQEPYDLSQLNANSAILDEEIGLWLVAERNFHISLNASSIKGFNKSLSGTITEVFGEILPEPCIKTSAEYSLVNVGFQRSFEDSCRFGTFVNSEEDARKSGDSYLKGIEGLIHSAEGRFGLKELASEQKKRISKKSGLGRKGSNIVNSAIDMTSISKEIQYNVLISSIASGFGYNEEDVKKSVDWAIKNWGNTRQGWLKIKYKNNEKIIERVIPDIERIR